MRLLLAPPIACALILFAGLGLRRLLRLPRGPWTLELASAIVLAIASLGIVGPIASVAGVHVPITATIFLGILAIAGAIVPEPGGAPRPAAGAAAAAAILLALGFAVYAAATVPAMHGDEIFVWGFKAGTIDANHTIDPSAWARGSLRGTGYPFALPVAASVVSTLAGEFGASTGRCVAILSFIACACAVAELVGLWFRGPVRFIGIVGILMSPVVASVTPVFMGDVPLLAAISLAIVTASARPASWPALVHIVGIVPLKIEGLSIAAALLLVEWFRCDRGARLRYALSGAAGLALCAVPWGLVFAIHGMNPLTGENLSSAARLGEVSAAARDPATLLARFGTTVRRLGVSYVPYATPQIRGVPWSGPGPLGWLLPAIALGAIPAPAARPAISWRAMLAFAGALVVGQAIPVALAPTFDIQLELVADRAAMHLIPVLFLIAFGLESWLRPRR